MGENDSYFSFTPASVLCHVSLFIDDNEDYEMYNTLSDNSQNYVIHEHV